MEVELLEQLIKEVSGIRMLLVIIAGMFLWKILWDIWTYRK